MTGNLDWLAHRTCSSCGTEPVGPGGILCPTCRTTIEAAHTTDNTPQPFRTTEPPAEHLDTDPDPGHLPL